MSYDKDVKEVEKEAEEIVVPAAAAEPELAPADNAVAVVDDDDDDDLNKNGKKPGRRKINIEVGSRIRVYWPERACR